MKSWEIRVFDNEDNQIKKKTIESNSRFFVKKAAKAMVIKLEGSSYSLKEIKDEQKD